MVCDNKTTPACRRLLPSRFRILLWPPARGIRNGIRWRGLLILPLSGLDCQKPRTVCCVAWRARVGQLLAGSAPPCVAFRPASSTTPPNPIRQGNMQCMPRQDARLGAHPCLSPLGRHLWVFASLPRPGGSDMQEERCLVSAISAGDV